MSATDKTTTYEQPGLGEGQPAFDSELSDTATSPHEGAPRTYGRNVGNVERWASVLAGAGLLAYAVRHRRAAGVAAGTIGTGLIARGLSGHCPVYSATGTSTRDTSTTRALGGDGGVHVHRVMLINRPVDSVYSFWRDLANLPRYMRHLESVTPIGDNRTHWVAKGPAGMRVEWDAEIINEEQNRLIAWRSLEGSDVVSAGSVNFREMPSGGGGTAVTVRLQYDPPAGKAGALIAKLFGEEPSQQIEEDLRRVKQFLETGEVATTAGQPSGRVSPEHDARQTASRKAAATGAGG